MLLLLIFSENWEKFRNKDKSLMIQFRKFDKDSRNVCTNGTCLHSELDTRFFGSSRSRAGTFRACAFGLFWDLKNINIYPQHGEDSQAGQPEQDSHIRTARTGH
jgi:hypothetical protein